MNLDQDTAAERWAAIVRRSEQRRGITRARPVEHLSEDEIIALMDGPTEYDGLPDAADWCPSMRTVRASADDLSLVRLGERTRVVRPARYCDTRRPTIDPADRIHAADNWDGSLQQWTDACRAAPRQTHVPRRFAAGLARLEAMLAR